MCTEVNTLEYVPSEYQADYSGRYGEPWSDEEFVEKCCSCVTVTRKGESKQIVSLKISIL